MILAAGESQRMGTPKPYLQIEKKSFVQIITENMKTCGADLPGFIVFNEQHRIFKDSLQISDFIFVSNNRQELGQIYSLQLALYQLPRETSGILFSLADHPLVQTETYTILSDQHRKCPDRILIPCFKGKKGHPCVFPSCIFREILLFSPEKPGGMKNILHSMEQRILKLDVDDSGILADLDTPKDLERYGLNTKETDLR